MIQMKKPNILVVLADQLRAFNSPPFEQQVSLPGMEAMIADGVRFDQALSTYPLCTPFRGMFMTGRHPQSTGIFLNFTSTRYSEIGLGDVFTHAGYRTGYVGKWHLNRGAFPSEAMDFIPEGRPRLGFDYWRTYNCHVDFWDGHINGKDWENEKWKGYETDGLYRYAEEFIAEENEKPWFLVVSPHQPHWNWKDVSAPGEYYDRLPAKLEFPPNVPEFYRDQPGVQEQYRHYLAMTMAMDEMLAKLRKLAGPETLVIFTSDHGTQMGAQAIPRDSPTQCWGKSRPHEESIRVPFFASWGGRIPKGTVRQELFTPVDFLPTLCGLAGVPIPRSVEGIDLSSAFVGEEPGVARDAAYLMNFINYRNSPNLIRTDGNEWRGLRTHRHTYVEWREGERMLYDLEADPGQMHNLAGQPGHAAMERELAGRLHDEMVVRNDALHPSDHYRAWLDPERRIIRNAWGPLPHPEAPPDWSLLVPRSR